MHCSTYKMASVFGMMKISIYKYVEIYFTLSQNNCFIVIYTYIKSLFDYL